MRAIATLAVTMAVVVAACTAKVPRPQPMVKRPGTALPRTALRFDSSDAGVLYVQDRGGLTAIDLEDGAVHWKRAGATLAGVGGGRALVWHPAARAMASDASTLAFELIAQSGEVELRFEPIAAPADIFLSLLGSDVETATIAWVDNPGGRGGAERPPPARHGAIVRLDLRTGRGSLLESREAQPGQPVSWLTPQLAPPVPIPPQLAGPEAMAPVRRSDGTIVMLRKQAGEILLYRWTEGAEPGQPQLIAREQQGRRISLIGAGDQGILLWDCPIDDKGDKDVVCHYELFAVTGKRLTVTQSSHVWAVDDVVLANVPDVADRRLFWIQRLDPHGAVVWSRAFEAIPPPAVIPLGRR